MQDRIENGDEANDSKKCSTVRKIQQANEWQEEQNKIKRHLQNAVDTEEDQVYNALNIDPLVVEKQIDHLHEAQ